MLLKSSCSFPQFHFRVELFFKSCRIVSFLSDSLGKQLWNWIAPRNDYHSFWFSERLQSKIFLHLPRLFCFCSHLSLAGYLVSSNFFNMSNKYLSSPSLSSLVTTNISSSHIPMFSISSVIVLKFCHVTFGQKISWNMFGISAEQRPYII